MDASPVPATRLTHPAVVHLDLGHVPCKRARALPIPGTTDMLDRDTAQDLLAQNFAPWVQALGPRIVSIDKDAAVFEIPITPDIARMGGIVCGQALATLADTAMVFACAGHLGEFQPVATTNLETRFLSAAKGEAVRCTARVIRAGRALIFAEANLISLPVSKPVAVASATFFRP